MTFELFGDAALIAQLTAVGKTISSRIEQAVWDEAGVIQRESTKETPVQYGILRGSQYIEDPKTTADGTTVRIVNSCEYAIPVHERTDVSHRSPTKAKFLEDPAKRRAPTFVANVGKRIAEAL